MRGKRSFGRWLAILPLLLVCPAETPAAESPSLESNEPAMLQADQLDYDQETRTATATGNVEVIQGDRVVRADYVTYDQTNNVVHAEGNVILLEPDGTVYFAEAVRLKDDLKQGVIDQFRAKLIDDSRFAALQARRESEDVIKLEKAVYSPCDVCEEDPDKPPLWQVKADKVKYDKGKQKISYRNAAFEVYGVPVVWTPYLSHSTPDADKKSGFLVPKYKVDSVLGAVVEAPYLFNLAPNYDLTMTPIYTSTEGIVMAGEYRHLLPNGSYEIRGSITNPKERDEFGNVREGREVRGHIEAKGNFHLNEIWDLGFNAKRTTDDTYLRRYDFSEEDTLTSRAFLQGIHERNYAIIQALSFQGLNAEDNPERSPLILPMADVYYESDPGLWGTQWYGDSHAMLLTRSEGPESRRLSQGGGVRLPYITGGGHVFELGGYARGDIYSVDNVPVIRNGMMATEEGLTGRIVPTAYGMWRYPLVQYSGGTRILLEPVVQTVWSSSGNNPDDIPNEDSQVIEFAASNLFSLNRYPGLDLVENGLRVNYGLRGGVFFNSGRVHWLVGQSYRPEEDSAYLQGGGLDTDLSDLVGRIGYTHEDWFDIGWRFRLEKEDLTPHRNEVNSQFYLDPLWLSLDYISFENEPNITDRDEMFGQASFQLTDNWLLTAHGRRDLSKGGGFVESGAGLTFQNECLTFITGVNREFTRDRDIEPATSFTFQVLLKNIN